MEVIKGARQLIKEDLIDAIRFEFAEMNITSHTTMKDLMDNLNGFSFFRILPYGRLLPITRHSPVEHELYGFQNIIAVRSC